MYMQSLNCYLYTCVFYKKSIVLLSIHKENREIIKGGD